jgi:hypothetical protein
VVSTTVLLLPEFLPDLVEDDAVVFSFNDLQAVVRTPRPRTLLWVDHSSRRRGGGRALVEAVSRWVRDLGVRRIVLRVTEGNAAAFALYRETGFVETGVREAGRPSRIEPRLRANRLKGGGGSHLGGVRAVRVGGPTRTLSPRLVVASELTLQPERDLTFPALRLKRTPSSFAATSAPIQWRRA